MTLNNMIFSRSFGCFPNLGVSQTWGHPCTICPGQKTTTTCITTLGTPWVGEFPWVPMMLPIQGIPTQLTHSWWNPLFCWLKSPILLYLPYETRQLDTLHLCVFAVPDSHFYHPKSPFGEYVFCWIWFHTKSPNVIHMSRLETSFQLGFPMKIPTINSMARLQSRDIKRPKLSAAKALRVWVSRYGYGSKSCYPVKPQNSS